MASSAVERRARLGAWPTVAIPDLRAWIAPALVVVACGPYVLTIGRGGVRTEQIGLYLLFAAAIVRCGPGMIGHVWRSLPPVAVAAGILAAIVAWTLVSTMALAPPTPRSPMGVVGSFESVFQPIALLIVLWAFVGAGARGDPAAALRRSARAMLVLLAMNAALAVVSTRVDLRPFASRFWGGPAEDGMTVADYAALNCRFSGIFNQPFEGGVAYSMGLFAWVYLDRLRRGSTLLEYACLLLVIAGGFVSVSKAFLLGGFWIAAAAWLFTQGWRRMRIVPLVAALLAVGVPAYLALRTWCGAGHVLALLPTEVLQEAGLSWVLAFKNAAYWYSGGRIGGGPSELVEQFLRVLRQAPLQGFGFGSAVVFDSGYAELLYQGGLVGLALYLFLLGYLAVCGWRLQRRGRPEGLLVLSIVGFIAFVGLGGPVVTLNRATVFLWVLTGLALLTASRAEWLHDALSARGTGS